MGAVPGGKGKPVRRRHGPVWSQVHEESPLASPPPFIRIGLSNLPPNFLGTREERIHYGQPHFWPLSAQTRGQGVHEALRGGGRDGGRKGAQNHLRKAPPELPFGVLCAKEVLWRKLPSRGKGWDTPRKLALSQGSLGPSPAPPGPSPNIEAACLPQPGQGWGWGPQGGRPGMVTMELEGSAYLPPAEFPRGPELHVLSKGSERRMPRVLGEVGVEAGEQESDGMPRSARMVEPAERVGKREGHTSHSEAHWEKARISTPLLGSQERNGWYSLTTRPSHKAQGGTPPTGSAPCPSSLFPPTNWRATRTMLWCYRICRLQTSPLPRIPPPPFPVLPSPSRFPMPENKVAFLPPSMALQAPASPS